MNPIFSVKFIAKAVFAGIIIAIITVYLISSNDSGQERSIQINQAEETEHPSPDSMANGPFSYAKAVQQASPAVINIYTARTVKSKSRFQNPLFEQLFGNRNNKPRVETGSGSGVIVSADGYILTNYHVIQKSEQTRVLLSDGRDYAARIIGSDPETDLAVLKIEESELSAITFNNSDHLLVGDVVLAIGNPYGVGQTVTMGIISATGRDHLGLNTFENFIQTDAAINPGNSGGALINAHGELVGISTAIFSRSGGSDGIGFAIPSSMAADVLLQIVKHGNVIRGWLGVSGHDIPPRIQKSQGIKGVLIAGVFPNGPADLAGIIPGDIITEINDETISSARRILELVSQHKPGSTLKIKALRKKNYYETRATTIQRPKTSNSK